MYGRRSTLQRGNALEIRPKVHVRRTRDTIPSEITKTSVILQLGAVHRPCSRPYGGIILYHTTRRGAQPISKRKRHRRGHEPLVLILR